MNNKARLILKVERSIEYIAMMLLLGGMIILGLSDTALDFMLGVLMGVVGFTLLTLSTFIADWMTRND